MKFILFCVTLDLPDNLTEMRIVKKTSILRTNRTNDLMALQETSKFNSFVGYSIPISNCGNTVNNILWMINLIKNDLR